jgi:anti-sigma factor RsiW
MNCEIARRLMETNDPSLAQHLRSCPSCIVGAHARYYEAPPALEQKIRASLRRETAPSVPWRPLAIAASILLAVSAIWNVVLLRSRVGQNELVAEDVFSDHLRSLNGTHLLDVPSSDQHTVKPWFAGKLDFSPPVKDVAGFPLLGGRLEYVAGHPAAALVYGRRAHIVNVFVWPSNAAAPESTQTRKGYHLRSWSDNGMAFWAISDLNGSELAQFVALLRQG